MKHDIQVINVEEQEDGSAILELELDEETRNKLLEYAIIDLLKKMIEREKKSG
jgi:hypothetical protein